MVIIFLLVVGLCVSSVHIHKRTEKVKAVSASYSDEQRKLNDANSKIDEMESSLEQKEKEKEELESKVSELQSQIELLKKKKAEEQAAAEAAAAAAAAATQVVPLPSPPPGERVCYLTFDDGPSDNTLKILDILDRYNIKATFFVTCNGKPEYVTNINAGGHTLGLHTASHIYSQVYASTDAYFADLRRVSDMVKSYTGIVSKIIRFPGGGSNTTSKKYCPGIMSKLVVMTAEQEYHYFDWNVDSGDANGRNVSPNKLVNSVLSQAANKNSICVLMHDEASKTTTVEALPAMIEGLSAMGYRFDKITEDTYGFHHRVFN
ncbi:MAG: polysaccharide deacetylase [Clostridia bacterium]|nr:polysaccharide deacetylase [Clostridia bacterium]